MLKRKNIIVRNCSIFRFLVGTLFIVIIQLNSGSVFAQKYELFSPDKVGQLDVWLEDDTISYSFSKNGIPVIKKSIQGLELDHISWKGLKFPSVKLSVSTHYSILNSMHLLCSVPV